MKWEIIAKSKVGDILDTLLKNRGIKTQKQKEEFVKPALPGKIKIEDTGISKSEIKKAIERINEAKKNKEKVIVYGDYDADGICATAILWEALYSKGLDVLPHIPDRFEEGYGLNAESVENLKLKMDNPLCSKNLKLIITVDNGIVAYEGVKKAKDLGIDVIVCDHHQKGKKKVNTRATIHTTKIGGAGVAWFLARELGYKKGLELAAIGTIADQLPLLGINRSLVKYGLKKLNETKRVGLQSLFQEAGINPGSIGTYEVGFMIAPRINSMGRMEKAIESLRLLCTSNKTKAKQLATYLGRTNMLRQNTVEDVVLDARKKARKLKEESVIVLASENYHEGVIGLAAARLVEEFYKPAIVFSKKKDISRASARSISGFNIIENIRKLEKLYIEGGGHPMAAGFSIQTSKIEEFKNRFNQISKNLLTEKILSRKLKVDLELNFNQLNWSLMSKLKIFNPTGLGNPTPTFMSKNVQVLGLKLVGREQKHLKLKLRQGEHIFDAIYFGGGEIYPKLSPGQKISIAYQLEENVWNGNKSLQLKIKDVKLP